MYRDSGASVDFKDINQFRQLCERVWSKKYGYLVIDKSKPDLDQKYRFQLELEHEKPVEINESSLPQVLDKKRRAIKSCSSCKLTMLSSSHAKHIKSKVHLKRFI